ncbi:MAG: VanZ family protein [Boseongicola sp.]|nr:VanZ family protein [Boseongicola sp.]
MPAILLAISVIGIVILGLGGKGFVATNDVDWVSDPPALEFRGSGLAYTGVLSLPDSVIPTEGATLILVLGPDKGSSQRGFQIIATFSSGDSQSQLAVAQWKRHLIVMNGDNYDHSERRPRLTTEIADDADRFVFLAIRLDPGSSELFVDGVRTSAVNSTLHLPPDETKLRLILGDSFELRNAWSGRIAGFALFQDRLPEAKLVRAWQHWSAHQRFSLAAPAAASVYYNFAQTPGAELVDLSGRGNDLLLPQIREPLQPAFASLSLQPSSPQDMLVNALGFMPFGFLLAWVLASGSRLTGGRLVIVVIIVSGLLSGAIEVSQAWRPARTSSMLDLILNISGAACGAATLALRARRTSGA